MSRARMVKRARKKGYDRWLAWLKKNGKGWDEVECVMCELLRYCPEHPWRYEE